MLRNATRIRIQTLSKLAGARIQARRLPAVRPLSQSSKLYVMSSPANAASPAKDGTQTTAPTAEQSNAPAATQPAKSDASSTAGGAAAASSGNSGSQSGSQSEIDAKKQQSQQGQQEQQSQSGGSSPLLMDRAGWLFLLLAVFGVGYFRPRYAQRDAELAAKHGKKPSAAEPERPKQLINKPEQAVLDAIEGLIQAYPNLARLDGFPDIKVVLRRDWDRNRTRQVAIISGGGSGHEPAHAGYVGRGMLTAAVAGDVFASPSVPAILAAIRAVARPKGPGVLLIVKNYTGDRINFGLAAEEAKAEGIPVEMVVVADDCATAGEGSIGRRGIAGTVLVHKIAGAAAENGQSLLQVAQEARRATESIASMGVALTTCARPGQLAPERLAPGQIEVGLGIHGEPGVEQTKLQPANELVDRVLSSVVAAPSDQAPKAGQLQIAPQERVVLLVNNLGTATNLEMAIVTRRAISRLEELGARVERTFTGDYMTALDMKGVSLSVLKADDKQLKLLDAVADAPGWFNHSANALAQRSKPAVVALPPAPAAPAFARPQQVSAFGRKLENALTAGMEALVAAEPELTRLDTIAGDGDCGQSMKQGAQRVLADLKQHYPVNSPASTAHALANSISQAMGGTSGALYRAMLLASYRSLAASWRPETPEALAKAFDDGLTAVRRYGGASKGYRTMLDALLPASEVLQQELKAGKNGMDALLAAVKAAESGAESTKTMSARAGRANYVRSELLQGTPDPGAKAAAIWLRAVYNSLSSEK